MRTMSRSDMLGSTLYLSSVRWDGYVSNATITNSYDSYGVEDYREDEVIPNYYSLSRRGRLFINPLFYTAERRDTDDITGTYHGVGFPYPNKMDTFQVTGPIARTCASSDACLSAADADELSDIHRSILESKALTGAFANASRSRVNYVPIVAEYRKTREMLKNPLGLIQKSARLLNKQVKRTARPGSLPAAKRAADRWMEGLYGWRPLIYDIRGVMENFQSAKIRKLLGVKRRKRFTSVAVASRVSADVPYTVTLLSNSLWAECLVRSVKSYRASAGVVGTWSTDAEELWEHDFGGTLWDLPLGLYDTIPYSFVGDWFFNFGDFIASKTLSPEFGDRRSWLTNTASKTQTVVVNRLKKRVSNYKMGYAGCGASANVTFLNISRIPDPQLPAFPVPELEALGPLETISSIAMIAQEVTARIMGNTKLAADRAYKNKMLGALNDIFVPSKTKPRRNKR